MNRKTLLWVLAVFLFATLQTAEAQESDTCEAARLDLLNQIGAEWTTQGIYTAVALGLPECLDKGPMHYAAIAQATGTDPEAVYRLLRLLASRGIFFEHEDHSFSHSERSKLLSRNHPASLNALTRFYGDVIRKSWEGLTASLQSGTPGFQEHFGIPVFAYFQQNPEAFALFHAAMAEKSKAVIASCLHHFDFNAYSSVYDIGGGKGHFLAAILAQAPQVRGVLFELPEVIAETLNAPADWHARCAFISGDFFTHIPEGGRLYLLKSVLHDWNDAAAGTILKNCFEAMDDESRLLVIEPTIGERNCAEYAKSMDLLMLNITGGKERTLDAFSRSLQEAGFTIEKVLSTGTEFKMILARKSTL